MSQKSIHDRRPFLDPGESPNWRSRAQHQQSAGRFSTGLIQRSSDPLLQISENPCGNAKAAKESIPGARAKLQGQAKMKVMPVKNTHISKGVDGSNYLSQQHLKSVNQSYTKGLGNSEPTPTEGAPQRHLIYA